MKQIQERKEQFEHQLIHNNYMRRPVDPNTISQSPIIEYIR